MSDTQKAFPFLKDNISQWLADLEEIDSKVLESLSAASANPPSSSQTSRSLQRSGSTESIRAKDRSRRAENAIEPGHGDARASSPAARTAPAEPSSPNTAPLPPQAAREAGTAVSPAMRRKRKTASLLSNHTTGQSGRPKPRSRNLLIVWYDSRIQKAFEQLVRNISSGRNMLRKGKMAAKLEALAAEVTEEDDDSEDVDMDRDMYMLGGKMDGPKRPRLPPSFARTRLGPPAIVTGEGDSSARFDETDALLESAQSLCEKAAYQFLREGDCREETRQAKEKLKAALERSIREVELQEERDKMAATKKPSEAQTISSKQGPSITATSFTFASPPTIKPNAIMSPVTTEDGLAPQPQLVVDVDEESDDGTLPSLPPIRYTRMTRT